MRFRSCPTLLCVLAALSPPAPAATPPGPGRSDGPPPDAPAAAYAVTWHRIDPGVMRLHGSCFRLSATAGQPVPGHGSGGSYVVTSGFWAAAPTHGLDEVFFNGFEECGP
jgi:hypothetical protein